MRNQVFTSPCFSETALSFSRKVVIPFLLFHLFFTGLASRACIRLYLHACMHYHGASKIQVMGDITIS